MSYTLITDLTTMANANRYADNYFREQGIYAPSQTVKDRIQACFNCRYSGIYDNVVLPEYKVTFENEQDATMFLLRCS